VYHALSPLIFNIEISAINPIKHEIVREWMIREVEGIGRGTSFCERRQHFLASKVPSQCSFFLLVKGIHWKEGRAVGSVVSCE
jgi:hypothetical protein